MHMLNLAFGPAPSREGAIPICTHCYVYLIWFEIVRGDILVSHDAFSFCLHISLFLPANEILYYSAIVKLILQSFLLFSVTTVLRLALIAGYHCTRHLR